VIGNGDGFQAYSGGHLQQFGRVMGSIRGSGVNVEVNSPAFFRVQGLSRTLPLLFCSQCIELLPGAP
jgi:hypothetical protein